MADQVVLVALKLRRWDDVDHYTAAEIALDSLGETPWMRRIESFRNRGDTLGVQRELARALVVVPHPSNLLLGEMPYAGVSYARRYVALSARDLGVATLLDSVYTYYDNKADAYARLGDTAHERIYYDSIRTKLAGRRLSGAEEPQLRADLALSDAVTAEAKHSGSHGARLGHGVHAPRAAWHDRVRALSSRASRLTIDAGSPSRR